MIKFFTVSNQSVIGIQAWNQIFVILLLNQPDGSRCPEISMVISRIDGVDLTDIFIKHQWSSPVMAEIPEIENQVFMLQPVKINTGNHLFR